MTICLYDNIRRRRKELGMTQSELAKKLHYADKSMIAKIEKGIVDLPQSRIASFAQALDTTPAALMGWVVSDHTQIDPRNMVRIPVCTGFENGSPILSPDACEFSVGAAADQDADFVLILQDRLYGDQTVYVRKQSKIEDGIPFVFVLDDKILLKRPYRYGGGSLLLLRPLESQAGGEADLEVAPDARDRLHTIGLALAIKRRLL